MSIANDNFLRGFDESVRTRPDHPAVVVVDEVDEKGGVDPAAALTYRQLDDRSRDVAHGLAGRGLRGSRALLLHPPGLEFVVALLGCFRAGVVAVPAPPPGSSGRGATRLTGIVGDAGVGVVLTGRDTDSVVRSWLDRSALASTVICLTEDDVVGPPVALPDPRPADVAFLQYTSGSTSEPKGVLVTHAALLHNEKEIARAMVLDSGVRMMSWLPHYHDMGLIGQLLCPLHNGGTSYLMAPMTFLKRPHLWLRAASAVRATMTVAPDFGWALVTRRTTDEQLAELDLSCLDLALNGSEPIHASTLEQFVTRFAPTGLRAEAMAPCYGMAEATLFVCGSPPGRRPTTLEADPTELEADRLRPAASAAPSRRLVSSGSPLGLDVRVVDPATHHEHLDGDIGEIWVRGGSVAAGYRGRPEETRSTFAATLSDGAGPFLRTGDLGALVAGELFVTGRAKDVIIVNGRNLYPQDIERTVAEAHPATGSGAVAVFSLDSDDGDTHGPSIVAVIEVRPADLGVTDTEDVVAAMRGAVLAEHEVPLAEVVLVAPGRVPRTTSGKVQRGAARAAHLDGTLTAATPVGAG